MIKFKKEYQNAKVIVKTPTHGKVEIDTTTADASKWSKIDELSFMFEDVKEVEQPKAKVNKVIIEDSDPTEEENTKNEYEDYTLNELRELFPNIKATSKARFIELIG